MNDPVRFLGRCTFLFVAGAWVIDVVQAYIVAFPTGFLVSAISSITRVVIGMVMVVFVSSPTANGSACART
jgi:hypothetical protein